MNLNFILSLLGISKDTAGEALLGLALDFAGGKIVDEIAHTVDKRMTPARKKEVADLLTQMSASLTANDSKTFAAETYELLKKIRF